MMRKMDKRLKGMTHNKGVAAVHLKVVAIKSNFIGAKPSHTFKLIITFGLPLLDPELDTILCSFTPSAGSAKSCPGIGQQH